MPQILKIGYPPQSWWRHRHSEPGDLGAPDLLASFARSVPLRFEMDLRTVWGLAELHRQACSLALDGRLLPPHPFDELDDVNLRIRYLDRVEESSDEPRPPFLHLLYAGSSGIHLPVPEEDLPFHTDLERGDLGSTLAMGRDMEELAGAFDLDLRKPNLLARLLAEWEAADPATSRAVERFLCAAVWESCRAAERVAAPLYADWYFKPKPPGLPFGYRAASYWGLDRITAVALEDGGATLVVEFEGGYRYRLPAPCALALIPDVDSGPSAVLRQVAVPGWGNAVELTLSDGSLVDLSTHSILSGYEPDYEHFGDFPEGPAADIRRRYEEHGPFRIIQAPAR